MVARQIGVVRPLMAPPRRIPTDTLKAKLAEMRAQGMTTKQIAKALGCYTAAYIAVLCGEWGFRINRTATHCDVALAQSEDFLYKKGQEGAPSGNASATELAAPDSAQGNRG